MHRVDAAYRSDPVKGLWPTLVFMIFALFFVGLGRYGFMEIAEARNVYNALFLEADKLNPVLSWLQGLTRQQLPDLSWAPRIPSAFAAVITLCSFYYILLGLTHRKTYALAATGILAFNLPLMILGHLALADVVAFGLWLIPTLLLVANIYTHQRSTLRLVVAGILLACCLLVRGVGPLLWVGVVVTLAVFIRGGILYNLRSLNPLPILVGALLVLVPWWRAMGFGIDLTPLADLFTLQNGLWFTDFQPDPDQPRWAYGLMLLVGFFPWVLFAPAAAWFRLARWRKSLHSADASVNLPLLGIAWVVAGSVALLLLPSYSMVAVLYLLPGLSLLVADRLDMVQQKPLHWGYTVFVLVLTLVITGMMALISTPQSLLTQSLLIDLHQYLLPFFAAFSASFHQLFTTALAGQGLGSTPLVIASILCLGTLFGTFRLWQGERQGTALMVGCTWVAMMLASYATLPRLYEANYGTLRNFLLQARHEMQPQDALVTFGLQRLSIAAELGFEPVNLQDPRFLKTLRQQVPHLFVVTTSDMVGEAKKALAPNVSSVCEQEFCLVRSHREKVKVRH